MEEKSFSTKNGVVIMIIFFILSIALYPACNQDVTKDVDVNTNQVEDVIDGVVNGIDTLTGLAYNEHFEIVRANCITCHSAKLITQNKATREGWKAMLVWMRETQNLHDLGDKEEPILDYLAKHYAPENKGRRSNLENVEWYVLESE